MATVTLYTFEDENGCEQTYTTFSPRDAEETAKGNGWLCIANEYEYSDREVAWDYRPKSDDDLEADAHVVRAALGCEPDDEE